MGNLLSSKTCDRRFQGRGGGRVRPQTRDSDSAPASDRGDDAEDQGNQDGGRAADEARERDDDDDDDEEDEDRRA